MILILISPVRIDGRFPQKRSKRIVLFAASSPKQNGPSRRKGRSRVLLFCCLVHSHCERLRGCGSHGRVAGSCNGEGIGTRGRARGTATATTTAASAAATASCKAAQRYHQRQNAEHCSPATPPCRNAEENEQGKDCAAFEVGPATHLRFNQRRNSRCRCYVHRRCSCPVCRQRL